MSMRSRTRTYAPKKRAASSRSTSKRTYKLRRNTARTVAIARPSVGLGTSATTVLRTSFFSNVTSAASGVFTGFLKPGSVFDPTGDLAGMQPQMFDQFAAMYNRYKVNSFTVRMKITGSVCNGTGTAFGAWVAAAYPAVDSAALATYQAAASQQFAKTTSGGFQNINIGANNIGTGTEGKYLSFTKIKHSSIIGDRVDPYDNGALVTGDPTALQYAVLPMFIQGNNAAVHTWIVEVDIWQNVTFSQKKNVVDA